MSFKGTTQAYLLKVLVTHNKKRIPLLNLLNSCKSVKSVTKILSIKVECTFHFSSFLIISLYNSLANFFYSESIPVPLFALGDFLSKNL